MEKTLAERAEEARLEEERRIQKRIEERLQPMVDYFSKVFPEAVYLGDGKFQLGDEVFRGNTEYHTCCKYGEWQKAPLYFLDIGYNGSSYYYFFNDLAGYGRYLHNKSLRSNKTNNTAMEEKRPQPKESWFTNFINWAKRYGK